METNTLLIQTLIDKVDAIQQKLENSNNENNNNPIIDSIERKTNGIFEQVERLKATLGKQTSETLGQSISAQLKEDVTSFIHENDITSNKFKNRWLQYGYIALVSILALIATNYSIRYYLIRGNSTKYEYMIDFADLPIEPDFERLDSIYSKTGDTRFRIKYMEE